jgi:hypothetical protein
MKARTKKPAKVKGKRPARAIDWNEAVADGAPTRDFLEDRRLADPGDLEDLVRDFVGDLESGYFATWEAVVRDEQDLPLDRRQKKLLDQLMSFEDEDYEDRVFYVNEIPRPSEPWYQTLRALAAALVRAPLDTASHYAVITEGWLELVAAVDEHAEGLSLPADAAAPLEVVAEDLRHRLWVQSCCAPLLGIGQDVGGEAASLASADEAWRFDEMVELLAEHEASVRALGLSLDTLGTFVTLPEDDAALLARLLRERLGLASTAAVLVAR